tara:strand:+ start:452 stop:928 length:477 start_codon:yes stop_codon:yes gene_type:complete
MKKNSLIYAVIGILFLKCDTTSNNNPISNIDYNTQISIQKENNTIYIQIDDYPEIAGFQFDLSIDNENLEIDALSAFGGVSEESNFMVSTGLQNLRILGFNLNGETIESGHLSSNTLIFLTIDTNGASALIGIKNVILSGKNGYNIPVNTIPSLISVP